MLEVLKHIAAVKKLRITCEPVTTASVSCPRGPVSVTKFSISFSSFLCYEIIYFFFFIVLYTACEIYIYCFILLYKCLKNNGKIVERIYWRLQLSSLKNINKIFSFETQIQLLWNGFVFIIIVASFRVFWPVTVLYNINNLKNTK